MSNLTGLRTQISDILLKIPIDKTHFKEKYNITSTNGTLLLIVDVGTARKYKVKLHFTKYRYEHDDARCIVGFTILIRTNDFNNLFTSIPQILISDILCDHEEHENGIEKNLAEDWNL